MKHFSANGAFSSVRTDITLFPDVFCGQPLGAARAVSQVGAALQIVPGMIAEVDILAQKKTVLDYILRPVVRVRDAAFRD